jgi:hypothetical protein
MEVFDMGHWGHGIWDNDTAMDIDGTFQDEMKEHDTKAEAMIATVKGWKRNHRDPNSMFALGDSDITLALADLQIEYNILVDEEILDKAIDFCKRKENLEDWSNPKEREEHLDAFVPKATTFLAKFR